MDMPFQRARLSRNSQVGGYVEGWASTVEEDQKVSLGMLFYVLNDVILAIFFFGSYIFLRGYDTNIRWFPPGTGEPPYLADFYVMLLAAVGAIAYGAGYYFLAWRENHMLFKWLSAAALILFLVDLAYQVYVMGHLPFTVADGSFAVSYLLLSGYHVYHMALAVFLGFAIVNRAFHGRYFPAGGPAGPASTPTGMTHATHDEEHGEVTARDAIAAGIKPLRNTTGPKSVGYYMIWAGIYALAFWLLVIAQPPYQPVIPPGIQIPH